MVRLRSRFVSARYGQAFAALCQRFDGSSNAWRFYRTHTVMRHSYSPLGNWNNSSARKSVPSRNVWRPWDDPRPARTGGPVEHCGAGRTLCVIKPALGSGRHDSSEGSPDQERPILFLSVGVDFATTQPGYAVPVKREAGQNCHSNPVESMAIQRRNHFGDAWVGPPPEAMPSSAPNSRSSRDRSQRCRVSAATRSASFRAAAASPRRRAARAR